MALNNLQIEYHPHAILDLEEIWLYTYRKWSLKQAEKYLDVIEKSLLNLYTGRKPVKKCDFLLADTYYIKVNLHFVFLARQSMWPMKD